MTCRIRPVAPPGQGWEVAIGRGATGFERGGFADRAAAEDWAARAERALRAATIRVGSKRFLATPAEALRRWAIDQGTLPRDEGGTQVAPLHRLAPLMEDHDCALPLPLLGADELVGLRRRRLAALGHPGAMLVEQAALSAAIETFRDFHLPALDDPFLEPAADGVFLLDDATCAQALGWAGHREAGLARAVGLLLTTGVAPAMLLACCQGHAEASRGRLHLPQGGVAQAPPELLPDAEADPTAPLLPDIADAATLAAAIGRIGARLGRPGMRPAALQLTGLTTLLRQGAHLDEIMSLAGAREAVLG